MLLMIFLINALMTFLFYPTMIGKILGVNQRKFIWSLHPIVLVTFLLSIDCLSSSHTFNWSLVLGFGSIEDLLLPTIMMSRLSISLYLIFTLFFLSVLDQQRINNVNSDDDAAFTFFSFPSHSHFQLWINRELITATNDDAATFTFTLNCPITFTVSLPTMIMPQLSL